MYVCSAEPPGGAQLRFQHHAKRSTPELGAGIIVPLRVLAGDRHRSARLRERAQYLCHCRWQGLAIAKQQRQPQGSIKKSNGGEDDDDSSLSSPSRVCNTPIYIYISCSIHPLVDCATGLSDLSRASTITTPLLLAMARGVGTSSIA